MYPDFPLSDRAANMKLPPSSIGDKLIKNYAYIKQVKKWTYKMSMSIVIYACSKVKLT
jgi:hypothetical protein